MRPLFALLLLVSTAVFADQSPSGVCFKYKIGNAGAPIYDTAAAACAAAPTAPTGFAPRNAILAGGNAPGQSADCYQLYRLGSPTGSEVTYDILSIVPVVGACSSPCEADKPKVINLTSGWARSGVVNRNDYVIDYGLPSASGCDGSCSYTMDMGSTSTLGECFRSGVPGPNGLYRVSCDWNVKLTGQSCSGTAPDQANPNSPPPPCPGTVGYINDRPVCLASSPSSPLPAASAPPGQGTQAQGNPAAGPAPSTGPGSGAGGGGRTPLVGNGGNGGGGSDASNAPPGDGGGGGTGGSGPIDVNVETCGLPGKPPCKIDETGTPDGKDAYTEARTAFDQQAERRRQQVQDSGNSVSSLPYRFQWGIPQGSCSPFQFTFGAGREWVVDVCHSPLIEAWRAIWGWVLAVGAALYMWRTATGAVGGGGDK